MKQNSPTLIPDLTSKRKYLLVFFLLNVLASFSQLMYENSYTNFSRIRKFAMTNDGGVVLAGQTGSNEMAMMKLDVAGNIQWTNAYNYSSGSEMGESVAQTLDGGYILVGSAISSGSEYCFVVKTNSVGVVQWKSSVTPAYCKRALDVTQLVDSSYIISVGSGSNSPVAMNAGFMKLSKTGSIVWSKSYAPDSWSCCTYNPDMNKILTLNNSSSMFALGSYYSGSSPQGYFIKFNSAGTILMEKRYSNTKGFFNGIQTADGNMVLVGAGGLLKVDTSGTVMINRKYTLDGYDAMIYSIVQLPGSGFLMLAYNASTDNCMSLIETDNFGTVVNVRNLSGLTGIITNVKDNMTLLPTSDGAYLTAFNNVVKKIPANILATCSSTTALFGGGGSVPIINNVTDPKLTSYTTPSSSGLGYTIVATASTVCSSTYCAGVSQPGVIGGASITCSGSSLTYSVAAVSGATSYSWALPGSWSGTSTTNSITVTTGSAGGTVSVFAVNACTASVASTLAVSVNDVPAAPVAISGNTTVCSGSVNSYSVAPVSGATSYSWTLPGGWSGTSTTNSITATAGTSGGNVSVSSINGCGTSTAQTQAVTVNSVPAAPASISGNTSVCSGSTTSFSVAQVSGTTSYSWTLPGGWSGTSTTNSITVTIGTNGGSISVSSVNGCGTSTAQVQVVNVNSVPATPSSISGNTMVCSGSTTSYNVVPVGGATSYVWTLPGGWSGTSTTNSITVTVGTNNGSISVASVNGCGTSTAQVQAVTVNPLPATPSSISGNATVCSGSLQSYSVVPVSGANSYAWTLPGGWSGTSTTNSISVMAGTIGGTIGISAANACGTSAMQTFSVNANALPAVLASTSRTLICTGETATLTASGASQYSWNTGQTTAVITVTPSITTGYTVTGTGANGCTNIANVTQSVSTCTGMEEMESNKGLMVYPNPSNGSFIVEAAIGSYISISNVIGEEVFNTEITSEKQHIYIGEFANGIYMLKIYNSNGQYSIKLIKE